MIQNGSAGRCRTPPVAVAEDSAPECCPSRMNRSQSLLGRSVHSRGQPKAAADQDWQLGHIALGIAPHSKKPAKRVPLPVACQQNRRWSDYDTVPSVISRRNGNPFPFRSPKYQLSAGIWSGKPLCHVLTSSLVEITAIVRRSTEYPRRSDMPSVPLMRIGQKRTDSAQKQPV